MCAGIFPKTLTKTGVMAASAGPGYRRPSFAQPPGLALIDRRALIFATGGLLAAGPGPAGAQVPAVDLALVLAADCSGSVRAEHYVLQQKGYADAFRQPEVIRAIGGGLHGAVAVTYFQWSGYFLQHQSIGWTTLKSMGDIARFAHAIETVPRTIFSGGTSPGGAIEFGMKLFDALAAEKRRRVIDVSGDGRSNNGPSPTEARDAAAAARITVNGLPILHMERDIDEYYEKNVIGGPGAFSIPARDFNSFGEAIRRKLILEIAGRAPEGMRG